MASHLVVQSPPASHELSVPISYCFQSPGTLTSLMLPRHTGLLPPGPLHVVHSFTSLKSSLRCHLSHEDAPCRVSVLPCFIFLHSTPHHSRNFNYLSGFSISTFYTTATLTHRPQNTQWSVSYMSFCFTHYSIPGISNNTWWTLWRPLTNICWTNGWD